MSDDNIIHVDFEAGRAQRPARKCFVPSEPPPGEAPELRLHERDPLADRYTFRDAARLFGVAPSRLRYWERSGFLARSAEIGARRYYTFEDLIGVRAAKDLLDEGVSFRAVRESVEALRASLPRVAKPLSAMRIVADGRALVVRDDSGAYEPSTGQLHLDFDVGGLRDEVVRVLRRSGPQNELRKAYAHYMEGCRLDEDESTFDEAEAAYRRAIELDPSLANAFTNLGNLLYRRGDQAEAERLYIRALQIDSEQPEAFYNLGFLLYDRGEVRAAILNFRRALRSDPSFSDAHFNLAMALHDAGELEEALEHWRTYLKLDPDSPWAEIARRHLQLHSP